MARDYERLHRRYLLDAAPDFVIDGGSIAFGKAFDVLEAPDTYARAPDDVIESARSLLEMDVVDTVPKMVHDAVTVRIGCCAVPVFALEDGGRGRTLFTFKCVYENCPAFLDVRVLTAGEQSEMGVDGGLTLARLHVLPAAHAPRHLPRRRRRVDPGHGAEEHPLCRGEDATERLVFRRRVPERAAGDETRDEG